jgi:hypothetical protein
VDLISMAVERPKLMKQLLSNVSGMLKYSKIRPLSLLTVFPM